MGEMRGLSDEKGFKLGCLPRWGETTCGFGVDVPACAAAATTHVMWLESSATSATCPEHLAYIEANSPLAFETHAHGPNCGMPGSLWHHPYEDEDEGYCLFPAPDDASLLAEEPLPVGASTRPAAPAGDADA